MSYGTKIATLRKSSGMTQAELGAKLNVTYQAVSKWERDESDPDFATMSKIAKLFDVPLSFFDDNEEEVATETVTADAADAPAAPDIAEALEQALDAREKREKAEKEKAEKEKRERHQEYEKDRLIRRRNLGLIVSAAITAALLVAAIVGLALSGEVDALTSAILCIALVVFAYTFIAQLFWDGLIVDVVCMGFKIIGTPGIIFSFDLDGFIFLITMKILFAIIKILGLLLFILFFTLMGIFMSPFAFFFQLYKISKGKDLG